MVAIFPTAAVVSFATGTGTAVTAEQTLTVPDNAVELVAVRGTSTATAPSTAESIFGVFKLQGDNFLNNPYEWFSELGSAKLSVIDQVAPSHEERWWPANLPVKPGANLRATYEPLDAQGGDGAATIDCKWATSRTGIAATKRLCTRETASSTSTGPALTLSDAAMITEYTVGYTASTVAADDPSQARLAITSGNLNGIQTITQTAVIHAIEATTGVGKCTLTHSDLSIPVVNTNANTVFSSTFTVDVALGTAGQYAYSVGYTPTTVQVPQGG